MEPLDIAEETFLRLKSEIESNLENILSEEDTKIQIIIRILTECLGWSHSDISAENRHDNGYSDLILKVKGAPILLVEAKRIGKIEIGTTEREKRRLLKLSGTAMKSAMSGVEQAASYASPNGLPIAVLTDGLSWIVFKSYIPGVNYKEKEAIVYPSLRAISNEFSSFFDLLHKNRIANKVYNSIFDEVHNNRLLLTQNLISPLRKSDIKLLTKSEIAFDLEKVFSKFFSRLAGDNEEDMLVECFVETHESRLADFSLEKITTSVLGNIIPRDRKVDTELARIIESNLKSEDLSEESGQTIFIVGPTGAGKSTFLERFFQKTLPPTIRTKCALTHVNCLDASGDEEIVQKWITEVLIKELENQLYDEGTPNWDDLLGLYFSEYKRRIKGVDKPLYDQDKDAFKTKFGEILDNKVETDREGYLRRILYNVVVVRNMLPVILIDNTDEFSIEFKEQVFQYCQSLRRHAKHCLIIFPVTDKSAWSFSKTDIFGIYKSRSFFLPTPSPKEVFRKRIEFIKKKISNEEEAKKQKGKYFTNRGIKISIDDLEAFANVIESIFVDQEYTSKTLGELTNYNIRRTLLLSQRVITSSVFKIDDLIASYLSQEPITTNYAKFMDALMRGNYEAYKPADNPEIYPIFQVDREVKQSPLLRLRILVLLDKLRRNSSNVQEKHMSLNSIINYFDTIGCPESSTERAVLSLIESGLVEPFDASEMALSPTQRLAISFRGIAHLRLASRNSVFFYQMALTTPILNEEVALIIRDIYKSNKSFSDKVSDIKDQFLNYILEEDSAHIQKNKVLPQYESQTKLLEDLQNFKSKKVDDEDEFAEVFGEEFELGFVINDVSGVIDFYDQFKGFGFVESDDLETDIYLPKETLEEYNIELAHGGDKIICDIERGQKGFFVKRIKNIEEFKPKSEAAKGTLFRVFHDRGYGFVSIDNSSNSAFFHFSVFDKDIRNSIAEGDSIVAELGPDKFGEGLQVKKIISYYPLK
tara:strand:+ start:318 stop:3275 length:2958 start_codon:yes stop_codon:yes gene_type:complete